MILINLTGDYQVRPDTSNLSAQSELMQLDAFIGALRGSVDSEKDTFLKALADMVAGIKRKKIANVALQITSELSGNTLTHEFKIIEI